MLVNSQDIIYNNFKMINKNYKKQIKLLDCTLRDGGSVNKWDFGHQNIMSILQNVFIFTGHRIWIY